jgi:hypothetical protein
VDREPLKTLDHKTPICYVVGIYDDVIINLGREIIRMSELRKLVQAWAFPRDLHILYWIIRTASLATDGIMELALKNCVKVVV